MIEMSRCLLILTEILAEDRLVFAVVIAITLRHVRIEAVLKAFACSTLLAGYWKRKGRLMTVIEDYF